MSNIVKQKCRWCGAIFDNPDYDTCCDSCEESLAKEKAADDAYDAVKDEEMWK